MVSMSADGIEPQAAAHQRQTSIVPLLALSDGLMMRRTGSFSQQRTSTGDNGSALYCLLVTCNVAYTYCQRAYR